MRARGILLKSYLWHRERMVRGILWASVVAKIKITWGGRLLQGLEKGVEGLVGEHVHFIDDVHFVFVLGGKILDVLPELPDFVDPPVGSPVDLQDIHRNPVPNLLAEGALVARMAGGTLPGSSTPWPGSGPPKSCPPPGVRQTGRRGPPVSWRWRFAAPG